MRMCINFIVASRTFSHRTLNAAGPVAWNNLSTDLRHRGLVIQLFEADTEDVL